MDYILLTGATGLLGSYIMKDILIQGFPLAVLARPNRKQSARLRVEEIMAHWEDRLGCNLPRPKVLEGDLTCEGLNLSQEDRDWTKQNCSSLFHNGASLTFFTDERNEPWRSNVDGVRNVLDFCKDVNIRRFHQVSTAYVAGNKTGTIAEGEVDMTCGFGNDYEESKAIAESEIRAAEHLDSVTFMRPSIVVGDSNNYFTSTYYGFYAMLKLAHVLVQQVPLGSTSSEKLMELLGAEEGDTKNLVPVDWVAWTMSDIVMRPKLHGETYHITSPDPISLMEMAKAVQISVERYSPRPMANQEMNAGEWFENLFQTESKVYQKYWSDDPYFDSSNTQRAFPHMPCPTVDRSLLIKMAKFAIEKNFRYPLKKKRQKTSKIRNADLVGG